MNLARDATCDTCTFEAMLIKRSLCCPFPSASGGTTMLPGLSVRHGAFLVSSAYDHARYPAVAASLMTRISESTPPRFACRSAPGPTSDMRKRKSAWASTGIADFLLDASLSLNDSKNSPLTCSARSTTGSCRDGLEEGVSVRRTTIATRWLTGTPARWATSELRGILASTLKSVVIKTTHAFRRRTRPCRESACKAGGPAWYSCQQPNPRELRPPAYLALLIVYLRLHVHAPHVGVILKVVRERAIMGLV